MATETIGLSSIFSKVAFGAIAALTMDVLVGIPISHFGPLKPVTEFMAQLYGFLPSSEALNTATDLAATCVGELCVS